ncbi:Hypothetical predicted protein [Mytilus galloprovincialis]|uniref:Uncharacterized protein n=1 Tax=Mytilus galloprovincialis TaxID=29158 RepID=A0A8B6DPW1_MYTGA|nr:Hypothetical predicted protein [Mytilus galloprovincialis]
MSALSSKSIGTKKTSWNRGAKLSITTNTVSDDEDVESDGSGNDLSDFKIISTTILQHQTTIESETNTPLVPSVSLMLLVIAIIGWTLAVILAGTTVFYKRQLLKKKSKTPVASCAIYHDLSGARELTTYSAIDNQASNEHYDEINLN